MIKEYHAKLYRYKNNDSFAVFTHVPNEDERLCLWQDKKRKSKEAARQTPTGIPRMTTMKQCRQCKQRKEKLCAARATLCVTVPGNVKWMTLHFTSSIVLSSLPRIRQQTASLKVETRLGVSAGHCLKAVSGMKIMTTISHSIPKSCIPICRCTLVTCAALALIATI